MIYFTSDFHEKHRNILKYSNRPFKDIDEQSRYFIQNWNDIVEPGDDVYIVGDVFFGRPEDCIVFLNRLNGNKYLIYGNHDRVIRKNKNVQDQFVWCKEYAEIKIPDKDTERGVQDVCLFHYACKVWNKCHYGSFQIFGHSHGSLAEDPNLKQMDVGVDAVAARLAKQNKTEKLKTYYRPISYEEVKKVMQTKKFIPVDHHKERQSCKRNTKYFLKHGSEICHKTCQKQKTT